MRLEIKEYNGPFRYPVAAWQMEVFLSRRNLLSLLDKLDREDSARRIESTDVYADGVHIANLALVLRSESDEAHYNHPLRRSRPGQMHPDTERFIAERRVCEPGDDGSQSWPMCEWREGVRPGMHAADRKYAWVYTQDRVWVDYHGCEHDIERMSRAYIEAVLAYIRAMPFDLILLLQPEFEPKPRLDDMEAAIDQWVESLPVVAALQRRFEQFDEFRESWEPQDGDGDGGEPEARS